MAASSLATARASASHSTRLQSPRSNDRPRLVDRQAPKSGRNSRDAGSIKGRLASLRVALRRLPAAQLLGLIRQRVSVRSVICCLKDTQDPRFVYDTPGLARTRLV